MNQNNTITGTWVSESGGFWFGAEKTQFLGTISATGQVFSADYTGVTFGPSFLAGGVAGGYFTFNGSIDSFAGWSAGVSGTAVAHAEYSMTTDGSSLVMAGAGTNVDAGFGLGYTTIDNAIPKHYSLPSVGSGVMPLELVLKLSGGYGLSIPAGYEFNELDSISEAAYRAGVPQLAPTKPNTGALSNSGLTSTGYLGDHPVPNRPGSSSGSPHPQKDVDLGPAPNSVYHDPIMDAARTYKAGTTYQDTIMRAAATYHPPAQPLAHPISVTPPPRPPSLSYGLTLTQAAIDALPYSMGTPAFAPVQAPVYVPHYAPATSPFPHAKPPGLGGGGLLNNVGNGLGRVAGAIFDPIAAKLDAIFHPNGYVKDDNRPSGSGDLSHEDTRSQAEKHDDHTDHPILLDLDGNGVKVNELSRSTKFIDAGGDGLSHRTAWAGAGDGVLFFDADGDEKISQKREYVFTEWGERRRRNGPLDRFRQRTRGSAGLRGQFRHGGAEGLFRHERRRTRPLRRFACWSRRPMTQQKCSPPLSRCHWAEAYRNHESGSQLKVVRGGSATYNHGSRGSFP